MLISFCSSRYQHTGRHGIPAIVGVQNTTECLDQASMLGPLSKSFILMYIIKNYCVMLLYIYYFHHFMLHSVDEGVTYKRTATSNKFSEQSTGTIADRKRTGNIHDGHIKLPK